MCDREKSATCEINGILETSISMIDAATETVRVFIDKGPLIKASFPDVTSKDATIEDRRCAREMLFTLFEMAPLLWNAVFTLEYAQQELDKAAALSLNQQ